MTRTVGQLVIDERGFGVPGEGAEVPFTSLDELRVWVRTDATGRYRPLSGARTLKAGWRFEFADPAFGAAAVETVYPLATIHQRQLAAGDLRIVSLEDVLARQSGRYEDSSSLPAAGRVRAFRTVCAECVRVPVWNGDRCAEDEIPCPEPCSVLVAFCREAAIWETDRPPLTSADATIAWAAFDEPGNELRERYLQEMTAPDE